jgi:general secretion pathway protein D
MTMTSPRLRPVRPRRPALAALVLAAALAGPALDGAAAPKSAGAFKSSAMVTVNFVNADIDAVTRAMAAMIDRQILVDPRVKGVITVYSEQPLTVNDAYLNYQAALRGLGFAVVDSAGLLKVVPEADAKLQAGTVVVGPEAHRSDQVMTQIFRLNHENPNNLVAVLRPLISPNNTINASPANNSLVITDYADNLTRLGKIIAALDQPSSTNIEVIPLRHAIATDLAVMVQKLGDGSPVLAAPGVAAAGALAVMADPRSNSLILRAANPARLASLRALVEQLDVPGVGGPAGSIHVVYLKNADAVRLATVLRAAFGGGAGSTGGAPTTPIPQPTPTTPTPTGTTGGALSAAATTPVSGAAAPSTGGFIQADPATNSLVITAAEPLYRQIRSVIDQLDGRRAQVFVESMIVEMDAQKAAEFGFQWQQLFGKNGDNYGVAAGTNFSANANIVNIAQGIATGNPSALPPAAGIHGLNIAVLKLINGTYTLSALARFLETVQGTNILATPNLVALDNEEAKIVVGANVPFVTGSFTNTGATGGSTISPFQTIERKDVGLTLRIKPQIGENGTIRMTVYQENSSVVAATLNNTNGPSTNKSSIETTVVVDDGAVMVLGGQLKDQYDGSTEKVPLLGDVPVLGNLFRYDNRTRQKTNLLVFLRPVVIRDAQTAASVTLDRYEAIRAQQVTEQPEHSVLLPGVDSAPVLPALPKAGEAPVPLTRP